MSWQPEMDELRRRQALASAWAGRQGQAPARRRPADGARAHRPAARPGLVPRDRQHRRQGRVRRQERPGRPHAGQLRDRPRHDRRPAGRGDGRRLHGARRLGRRHDQGEGPLHRALRQPVPHADHPADRRLGRRRLGQDHRDHRPRQRAGRARLGMVVQNMGTVPVVGLGLGSVAGPGRGAAGGVALLGDGEGDVGDVRRRPAGGEAAEPASCTKGGTGRLGDPAARRRRRRGGRQRGGGLRRHATFLSYLPSSVFELPPRGPQTDDPERREELLSASSRATSARSTHAADRRDGGRPGQLLRDGQALRPRGDHRLRAHRRLAGRGDGERPDALWRRLDGRRLPEGDALHRPGRDLPSADGLSGTARAS